MARPKPGPTHPTTCLGWPDPQPSAKCGPPPHHGEWPGLTQAQQAGPLAALKPPPAYKMKTSNPNSQSLTPPISMSPRQCLPDSTPSALRPHLHHTISLTLWLSLYPAASLLLCSRRNDASLRPSLSRIHSPPHRLPILCCMLPMARLEAVRLRDERRRHNGENG